MNRQTTDGASWFSIALGLGPAARFGNLVVGKMFRPHRLTLEPTLDPHAMFALLKAQSTPARWACYALGLLLIPVTMAALYGIFLLVDRYLFRL